MGLWSLMSAQLIVVLSRQDEVVVTGPEGVRLAFKGIERAGPGGKRGRAGAGREGAGQGREGRGREGRQDACRGIARCCCYAGTWHTRTAAKAVARL